MNYMQKGTRHLNKDNCKDKCRDHYNTDKKDYDQYPMKSQQFPSTDNQPRTPPPNFIPEGPDMNQRGFGGPEQFGAQYGGIDRRRRPGQFRGCLFRFTYIWLNNGNNFWFFPTFVSGQFIQGWRWRRNRWEFDRINIRRILFFRCF